MEEDGTDVAFVETGDERNLRRRVDALWVDPVNGCPKPYEGVYVEMDIGSSPSMWLEALIRLNAGPEYRGEYTRWRVFKNNYPYFQKRYFSQELATGDVVAVRVRTPSPDPSERSTFVPARILRVQNECDDEPYAPSSM